MPAQTPVIHLGLSVREGDPRRDGVRPVLEAMDAHGIARGMLHVDLDRPEALRALKDHPDRFFAAYRLDPNRGMDEIRKIVALYEHVDLRALTVAPARLLPQVPLDGARLYPFYAKAVELGIPVCCHAGVPRERVPMLCQHPRRLDEVCTSFPDLRVVLWDDGVEPWTRLVVTLLGRHPNLFFAATGTRRTLAASFVAHAHDGGAGRLLFAGAGRAAPLRDDARSLFLGGNAMRVFALDR